MPREKYTEDEDARLTKGVAEFEHASLRFALIKNKYFPLSKRNSKSLRDRWEVIDPSIKKEPFSEAERQQIARDCLAGKKFADVAKSLSVPGARRTCKQVENLYTAGMNKLETGYAKPLHHKEVPEAKKPSAAPKKKPRTKAPAAKPDAENSFATRDARARAAGVLLIDPVAMVALLEDAKASGCGPNLEGYDLVGAARKMLAPESRSPLQPIDQNTSGSMLNDSDTLDQPLHDWCAEFEDEVLEEADAEFELEGVDVESALELAEGMVLEEGMPAVNGPVVETEAEAMAVDMWAGLQD